MPHHRRSQRPGAPPTARRPAGPAEHFQRGLREMRAGNNRAAEASYRLCIATDAHNGEAHHHLGLLLAKRGADDEAASMLRQAAALRPDQSDILASLCTVLRKLGDAGGAIAAARRATGIDPHSGTAHRELGLALIQGNAVGEAADAFARAVACGPRSARSYFYWAAALKRLRQPELALEKLDLGLRLDPDSADGLNERGLLHEEAGRLDQAVADLLAAHRHDARNAVICTNLAHVYGRQHNLGEALHFARRAVDLDPESGSALGNLGMVYQRQGRAKEAIETFSRAIDREPSCIRHYTNLGALLIAIEQTDTAVAACRLAVTLDPRDPDARFNLAVALRQKGDIEGAIAAYMLANAQGSAEALVDACHLRQQICDWSGLAAQQARSHETTFLAGKRVAPFSVLTATGAADRQRRCAAVFAAGFERPAARLASDAPRAADRRSERIRVGYLSSDFFQHATTSLIAELFERHDRGRFALFAYSYGPDDGSAMRQRVIDAFDSFVDIREMSHPEAAARIHADAIDILIDLKGYTQGARTEILCYRPAPIQVNYLGYPGTMAAPFVDYLIADPFVAPRAHADQFSEAVVHLPHCYQPNDRRRPIAADIGDRAAFGLPPDGFVFCSFNNSYKITPEVFAIWMRLMRAVPGSVLWLLETNPLVARNLRREAIAQEIDPARLVFAPRIRADQHIARMALADLFLDTLPVNAHTTASEALWAGLPVLTCAGESFVGRVAGSLLHAVGLPDLITGSLADYEAKALDLARDPAALAAIRERLRANRLTTPLFDIARYTRHFERALERMCALRDAGTPPEPFTVETEA